MTDLSTLTDTELNKRLMVLDGWAQPAFGFEGWIRNQSPWRIDPLPFADSIDALKAGPEKLLREAGWVLAVTGFDGDSWSAEWWKAGRDFVLVSAPTEARARAEAVCLGLEASK